MYRSTGHAIFRIEEEPSVEIDEELDAQDRGDAEDLSVPEDIQFTRSASVSASGRMAFRVEVDDDGATWWSSSGTPFSPWRFQGDSSSMQNSASHTALDSVLWRWDLFRNGVDERTVRFRRLAVLLGIFVVLAVAAGTGTFDSEVSASMDAVTATTTVFAEDEPIGEEFYEPKRLYADNLSGELLVHLSVDAAKLEFGGVSFNVRTFNNIYPAPTIVIRRGERLRIVLDNKLESDANAGQTLNALRKPNTTNIHTHGLHVSPSDSDNVFRTIEPKMKALFDYPIPKNHPQGTFFIHPHFHGSTSLQTAYAMAIALIVEENNGASKLQVDEDHVFLLGLVDVSSGSRTDVFAHSKTSGSDMKINKEPKTFDKDGFIVVNGKRNPSLKMKKPGVHRWRVINAIIDGVVVMKQIGECSMSTIAADGISFEDARREETIVIPPGSRRDLLVSCWGNGKFVSEVETGSRIKKYLGNATKIASGDIARVFVEIPEEKEEFRKKHGKLRKSSGENVGYTVEKLKDLRSETPVVKQLIEYTQGGPNTPQVRRDGNLYSFLGFNGKAFDPLKSLVDVKMDQVVEWTIRNEFYMDGTVVFESHPFHLHTNHFQVVGLTSNETGSFSPDFQIGDWRDTISVPAPGKVTIRWIARDFHGPSLMHCHILSHSDNAMIARVDLLR